jgi:HAD superfamily hydrolase (TIGR01549 family)
MRVPASTRAVLFDWDGTLVDSAAASLNSYVTLFAGYGIPYGPGEFERTYSPDWYRTYAALGLPRDKWDEADARWLEIYARERSDLLPGAFAALDHLKRAGLALGLVTSGSRPRVEEDLARLEVERFFSVVVCGGDTARRKPHPEPLQVALDRLDVESGSATYVGDSPEDIEMARGAGVFAIGIPGGFPNRAALAASRPDLMAEDIGVVPRLLAS